MSIPPSTDSKATAKLIRGQGKNDPLECTVVSGKAPATPYCSPTCRYFRNLNNQACQNSLKEQLQREQDTAAVQPQSERIHAYDKYICGIGKPLGRGNPKCCMVIDPAGVEQAATGVCARFANNMVKHAIREARAQRKEYLKTAAGKQWLAQAQTAAKIENKQLGNPEQSTTEYFASSPDMWVAAAAVGAGATFFLSTVV